jgi:hypothetical protein
MILTLRKSLSALSSCSTLDGVICFDHLSNVFTPIAASSLFTFFLAFYQTGGVQVRSVGK